MAAKPSPVSPDVLAWAVAEDGRPLRQLADALKVDSELLEEWLAGGARPTKGQVSALAKVLKRPRALFFLPSPPVRATMPASYRHPPGDAGREVSAEGRRRVRQALRVQQAVSWALRDEPGLDLPLSGVSTAPEVAAADVRAWLGVADDEQRQWKSDYQALKGWRDALEERGVLVFALEIGRDDVRGFSAWDERAPLVVTNVSGVTPAARSFTLAHELGHLVTRKDAACMDADGLLLGTGVERWCERFGAALLMPPAPMRILTTFRRIDERVATIEDVKAVAAAFRASHRAAALRLIDLGFAGPALYAQVLAVFKPKPPVTSLTSFVRPARSTSRMREYGPRALRTVLAQLPQRDALSVLRVTVEDVRRISDKVPGVPTF